MFLQVSVCPHRGGMCGFIQGGGACVVLFREGGMRGFIRGACMVLFGGGMRGFIRGGGRAWFFQFFRIQ